MAAVRGMRVPVIAAVNGAARRRRAGAGAGRGHPDRLARGAKFNAAFVRIGLSAGDLGTSWLLPRLIGPAAAAEFAYTGRLMDAAEAERTGLVNRVVPADELLDSALETAALICANSPGGVRLSKRALHANMEASSFAAALELENRGQALLTRTADMTEALDAFREGRAPRFDGDDDVLD